MLFPLFLSLVSFVDLLVFEFHFLVRIVFARAIVVLTLYPPGEPLIKLT